MLFFCVIFQGFSVFFHKRPSVKRADTFSCSNQLHPIHFRFLPKPLFICLNDIRKSHMLITELLCSCLLRQMNRMLRTVMQAGITDLAVFREAYAIFRDFDVICRTYLCTDSAANHPCISAISDAVPSARETLQCRQFLS